MDITRLLPGEAQCYAYLGLVRALVFVCGGAFKFESPFLFDDLVISSDEIFMIYLRTDRSSKLVQSVFCVLKK